MCPPGLGLGGTVPDKGGMGPDFLGSVGVQCSSTDVGGGRVVFGWGRVVFGWGGVVLGGDEGVV